MRIHLFGFIFLGLILFVPAKIQAQDQAWVDYILNLPFANNYVFDTEFSYKTNFGKESKWRSYDISPDIEWSINDRFDVMFSVGESFTVQKEDYNTIEIKPLVGTRFHITPHQRILIRALVRFEYRNLYHEEDKSWDQSTRSRFRLEAIIPINRKTYFENKLWYALTDAEVFWVMDEQLDERYANRARYRVGVGYRASYSWRFELVYTNQQTKNTIDDEANEVSNIFRFRVKHFINKTKPVSRDPNGN